MTKELIIRSGASDVDFALLKNGRLVELHKEEDTNRLSVGDIMLAKIHKPICECRIRKGCFLALS